MNSKKLWQFGAAIKISGSKLACEIAKSGHIGEIGGFGLTEFELISELDYAKNYFSNSKNQKFGKLYINLMTVAKDFSKNVEIVKRYDVIDGIVLAAGMKRDIFKTYNKEVILKLGEANPKTIDFIKKYTPIKTVILENPNCGGHINYFVDESIGVSDLVRSWRKYDHEINLVSAGGINDTNYHELLNFGNNAGNNISFGNGLFFYVTEESSASLDWILEQIYQKKEPVLFESSVKGLIGRALKNEFIS